MRAFFAMLIAMVVVAQSAIAHAQSAKAAINRPAAAGKTKEVACLADALEHEAQQNTTGRVSVGHAILVRASAKGGICRAIYEKGQFSYLGKKNRRGPSSATLAIAQQMVQDWKNGKPTIEVKLQRELKGCAYFVNRTIPRPQWAKNYARKGGYCGFIAGHDMFRNPGSTAVAYAN